MALFSIEISDGDVTRVLDAISANYNRPINIPDPNDSSLFIENTESKASFANRMVRHFLSEHVNAYEIEQAKKTAVDNINTSVTIEDPQV